MITVPADHLLSLTKDVFTHYHVPEPVAQDISTILVHANLRGVDSHGVMRVEHYINRLIKGGIRADATPDYNETSPSTGIMDGHHGFGHSIAKEGMSRAIHQAKQHGIGSVAVKNSSHCGALSFFVQQAAEEKLIGIAMSHTDAIVVPYGGAEPYFGTNPLAFGFPTNEEDPVILDFATSTVALGKILDAKEKQHAIPHGWGVNDTGQSTTIPEEVVSLTPFGGPKGYGLAMVVEIFSALLTGAAFGPHVSKMYDDYHKNRELGHFFMAIDPSKFIAVDAFTTRLDGMIRELRQVPAVTAEERIYVPGELEKINERERLLHGIPLPESVYNFLKQNH